jgi:translation initiation factor 1
MTMGRGDGGDRLVYSSEQGRMCPECGRSERRCVCRGKAARARIDARKAEAAKAASDGIARVGRSTKGRKGKVVTTVTGLVLEDAALSELAGELKRRCGSGGAVKDGVIEIQGEHRDTLIEELERRGFETRRVG